MKKRDSVVVVPVRGVVGKNKKRFVTTGYLACRGMVEARAYTEAQALARLEEQVDQALQGEYGPRLIVAGRLAVLVYRRPNGWFYAAPFDLPEWGEVNPSHHCTYAAFATYEECEQRARFHLAQNVVDIDDPARALSLLTNERDRQALAVWVGFQRAYRAAVEQGQTEVEAQTWATMHALEFVPQEEKS